MPINCSRHLQSNSICSLPKRAAVRLPTFCPFSEFATQPYGDEGLLWLLEYNQVLQTTPLDLVLRGKAERVLTQLGRIEHGVYV